MNKIKTLSKLSGILAGSLLAGSALAADQYTDALEQKIEKMEQMLNSMQTELQQVRSETRASAKKVQVVEERVAVVNRVPSGKNNMIFFRGGFSRMNAGRGNQVFTDLFDGGRNGAGGTQVFPGIDDNDAKGGYYVGAGIEHSLTNDLWGMSDMVAVFGEIMFEYKKFDSKKGIAVVPAAAANLDNAGAGPVLNDSLSVNPTNKNIGTRISLSQFTLTAAPKLKFNPSGNFHPWLIPAGFAFHVISPPSDSGTVLTAGVVFGAGLEYEIGKLVVGVDSRYYISSNDIDGVDTDGLTAGGYVGFNF